MFFLYFLREFFYDNKETIFAKDILIVFFQKFNYPSICNDNSYNLFQPTKNNFYIWNLVQKNFQGNF